MAHVDVSAEEHLVDLMWGDDDELPLTDAEYEAFTQFQWVTESASFFPELN